MRLVALGVSVIVLGYTGCSGGGSGGGTSPDSGSGGSAAGGTSGKGAGELCNLSTECKLGLTCPEGKCQAKCATDEDCAVIDPEYGCPAGQCEKVDPWKCAYFPNVPDLCVCQWKSVPAGEVASSCSGECCGTGTENGIPVCQCFSIQPGDVPCDEQHAMYDPPMTKVASCPPPE